MINCVKKFAALLLAAVLLLPLVPIHGEATFEGDDKIVVVLDPGHGGYDPGASKYGIAENVWSLEVAKEMKAILEENGNFVVYLTRTTNTYLGVSDRGIIANRYNADLLFSIHFDANGSSNVRGATFITSVFDKYAATGLGEIVLRKLSSKVGLSSRGILRRKDDQGYYWNAEKQWDCQDSSLGVLSDYYGIPTWGAKFGYKGVIVEHGFLSSKADTDLLHAAGARGIAEADAEAIIEYYTNHTHSYAASATVDYPSNCTFVGKESVKCTRCGHRKNVTTIEADPDNHYWINEEKKKASCGVDGYIYHECRIASTLIDKKVVTVPVSAHEETILLKAEPHDYEVTDFKEVSHAVDGYTKYKCKKCGDEYTETVKCEGHSWSVTEEVKPTCTEAGKIVRSCSGCDETKTEKVDALGHKMKYTVEKEPTCTEEGLKKGKCSVCGHEEEAKIEALGHTLEESTTLEAGCETAGTLLAKCTSCDFEEEKEIAPLGHEIGEDSTCVSCGMVMETEPPETEAVIPETEAETGLVVQDVKVPEAEDETAGVENKKNELLAIILVAVAAAFAIVLVVVRIILAKKSEDEPDADEDDEEEKPTPAEEVKEEAEV